MSIPETQLEKWCNQGATVTSAAAYNSIRTALNATGSPIANKDTEIYLQGSYGNSTNIYADSDVDVVVQYNEAWYRDLSALPTEQQAAYNASYINAGYGWKQFHADVLQSLRNYYGSAAVTPGNKSIKVKAPNGRIVDVIPSFQLRNYEWFVSKTLHSFKEGVQFADRTGRIIINYPKLHIANGEEKNSIARTGYRYKQTVRMFKNARNAATERRLISAEVAPSYFVECLIYNAPDHLFTGNRQETFRSVHDFLWSKLIVDNARCQNEQMCLCGNTPEQWDKHKLVAYLDGLAQLWNNW